MLRLSTLWWLAAAVAGCVASHDITPDPDAGRTCPSVDQDLNRGIDWYFPARAGDNEQLERWCVTVGPVVLDTLPAADFGRLEPADSLRIAVWNTDAGAGYVTAFLEEQLGLTCNGSASALHDDAPHFVLLLQEALRRSNDIPDVPKSFVTPPPVKENAHPGPRLDVVEVARQCGLAYFYAPAARNDHKPRDGKREDKGNAILSTLPLSDPIVVELPFEAARRVVPMATVRGVARDSLRLASVHLITTPPPSRALLTGGSSRWRQAMGLAEALRAIERDRANCPVTGVKRASGRGGEMCPPPCPGACPIATVIAGDLNTWSTRETTLRHLLEHFPDSPRFLEEPTRGPFPTDHLLFRTGSGDGAILTSSYRRIADAHYSDHNPIVAVVGIP